MRGGGPGGGGAEADRRLARHRGGRGPESGGHTTLSTKSQDADIITIAKPLQFLLVPQIDPSVPQPVVQSRRRPLLGPSPG